MAEIGAPVRERPLVAPRPYREPAPVERPVPSVPVRVPVPA